MFSKLQAKKLNKKGFTLIELIVVIAIIGILAAVLIPRFTGFTDKAQSTAVVVAAKQIATAGDAYYTENNATPTAAQIVTLAGPDITTANIGNIGQTGGHITFTYFIEKGSTYYAAYRKADGTISTGTGATSGAAITATGFTSGS